MNLTIDRGNSSTKLTLWDDGRAVDAVTVADLTADGISRFAGGKRFDGVILSAVAPVAAEAEEAARTLGRRYVRLSADTPTPLDFSLYDISRLGADRIAAAVGARSVVGRGPLLVGDLGTASTFDFVDAGNRFCGGVISAGVGMRLDALHDHTSLLPSVAAEATGPLSGLEWTGRDTAGAMLRGAVAGTVGELLYYKSLCPADTTIVLTGGYSEIVKNSIPRNVDVVCCDNLTGLGLNSILNYNEA